MTFTDILGRDIRIEWHEAVALVLDVAARMGAGAAAGRVPGLHQVELLSSGQVEIHGGDSSEPVERLAQMLQVLLEHSDPPVQLRLLLSPAHESVAAYAASLEFFERPDRTAILQALYSRASTAPRVAADDDLAALGEFPAEGSGETETKRPARAGKADKQPREKRPPLSPRGRRVVRAAAALTLMTAAAGALYAGRAESSSPMSGAAAMMSGGISGVASAVESAVSAIGERVGAAPAEPTPAEPVEAGATKPSRKSPPAARRNTRKPQVVAAGFRGPVPVPLPRPGLSAFDFYKLPGLVAAPPKPIAASAPLAGVETVTPSPESVVYSPGSRGVKPPIAVRPNLPSELPPGLPASAITRIDILIRPDGTVEAVKLLDPPRTVHDWMLLSAAKAWQFHPAMRAGVPVTYRQTLRVAR